MTKGLHEKVLEFKHFGFFLVESDTYGAECHRKVESGGRVAGAVRSLVNGLELECCMRHCLCLLCCMVVRQWRGLRKGDLGLELCRCTTLDIYWALREWMEYRMHG